MNQAPPDKVDLRNAIAIAKQLKKYALDLENVDTKAPEMLLDNPF
jgi:hypothetical protein